MLVCLTVYEGPVLMAASLLLLAVVLCCSSSDSAVPGNSLITASEMHLGWQMAQASLLSVLLCWTCWNSSGNSN